MLTGLKDEPQARSELLLHLTEIYQGMAEYSRAEPLAVERFRSTSEHGTLKDRVDWFEAGVTLSSVYYGGGKIDALVDLTGRLLPHAAEIRKVVPDSVSGLYVMRGLGLINRSDWRGVADLEAGVAGYRSRREINSELSNNFVHSARTLASTYGRLGQYRRADALLAELIEYTKHQGDTNSATVGSLYVARGHLLNDAGRFLSAIASYDEARRFWEKTKLVRPAAMIPLDSGTAQASAQLGEWKSVRAMAADVLQRTRAGVPDSEDIPTRGVSMALARATGGELSIECQNLQAIFEATAGKKIHDVLVRNFGAQSVIVCALANVEKEQITFARALLAKRASLVEEGEVTANPRIAIPLVIANAMMELRDDNAKQAVSRTSIALTRRTPHEPHSVWLHLLSAYGAASVQAGHFDECRSKLQAGLSEMAADRELQSLRPLRAALHFGVARCAFAIGDGATAKTNALAALALQAEFESPASENTSKTRALLATIGD